jgi:ABC-type sugar transport system ATPase subunit
MEGGVGGRVDSDIPQFYPLGVYRRSDRRRGSGDSIIGPLQRRGRDRGRLGSHASTLSGGNQQKVALGKWLGIEPRLLLVDEPTRGVDVGARAEIYGHLRRLADDGLAIVFASSDTQEALGLADTIISFYRGREIARYDADEIDEATLVRDITHPDLVHADDG